MGRGTGAEVARARHTASGVVFLQVAHDGARIGIGMLMAQRARQMRGGRAAHDARASLQRAERGPAAAVLSKPRLDAFGGGAAIISAKTIKSISAGKWLYRHMARIARKNGG